MVTEYLVALNQLEDVAVHHECEDAKQKHQAHLYEPLFYGDAQIATQRSFDEKHQNVAAVQNWYRQQIQQAEIQAYHRSQHD